jgi:uncharacterized YigZ family protein
MNSESSPDADQNRYLTLAGIGSAEIKVQRSRFLAEAAPADDLNTAKSIVTALAKRYHDCRHVCYAWRGGVGPTLREKHHDAGEPHGTAGAPILAALRSTGITNCVVVVARYFGGIKLGTGGLARAYGEAAAKALAAAPQRTVVEGQEWVVQFPYAHQKSVAHVLARHGGHTLDEQYTEEITWRIWLPTAAQAGFAVDLREATANEAQMKAPAE